MLSIAGTLAMMLMFCSIPLQNRTDLWGVRVSNITALPDLYAFDLTLFAENWNIVSVTVRSGDLDVFASADAYAVTDDKVSTTLLQQSSLHNRRRHRGRHFNNELLGHVKLLRPPAVFPAFTTTNATARAAIVDPSNSIGKIIYMNYPYTMTINGHLKYSTGAGLFLYHVPICSIHRVESIDVIVSLSCLDDGNDDQTGGGGYWWWVSWLFDWFHRSVAVPE
jgi:hypothetical protein